MRTVYDFQDYEILDTSAGEKLERWGNHILIRPDPQIIWNTEKTNPFWKQAEARYLRSDKGGGEWKYYRHLEDQWTISYHDLTFRIRPTGFKHTGLFPEQAVNWNFFADLIGKKSRPINVLNLFAYTGGATLACAAAGASVCHVDASKGMVAWAKENAQLSHLEAKPVRWIVDDCEKFVAREMRRGHRYDGIIMDPPSYGRGPNGEVWKLEEQIFSMVDACAALLSDDPLFFVLNSYTTGLSPSVMQYLLNISVAKKRGGHVNGDEIGLPVSENKLALPCGSTAIWQKE